MTDRKLRVGIVRYPYGGNGSSSSEHPDVSDWLVKTVCQLKLDPRVEDVIYERFSDTPICMTRNRSVAWGQQNHVDVLIMVDSDMAPDLYVGHRPEAKPFFQSSFDFLYENFEKHISVIVSPYCGPPTHPTEGGMENVYVFRWTNYNTGHNEWPVRMEAYGRMEASLLSGISNIDTGPTGLCMIDMRVFEHLSHPYFDYEWEGEALQCKECKQQIPGPRTDKATTEDCYFFRNIVLNATVRLGYNPVYCNWDAWSGHWKPWCVGKPAIITSDMVGRQLHQAVKEAPPSGVQLKHIGNGSSNGHKLTPKPREDVIQSIRKLEAQRRHGNDLSMVASFQSRYEDELDNTPREDDLGHRTPADDIKALNKVIGDYVGPMGFPEKRPLVVVELGAWVGKSALAICGAMPPGQDYEVHCVDLFSIDPTTQSQWATLGMWEACKRKHKTGSTDPIYDQFVENTASVLNKRIFIHRISTTDAAACWRGGPIDILFVDADHTAEAVLQDLKAWMPYVRSGGLICGHDHRTFAEVRVAVDEVFGEGVVKSTCDVWWTTKDGNHNEAGTSCESSVSG